MKQYKITVNGQSYDVSVEEVQGSGTPAGRAAPQAQAQAQPAAVPLSSPAPAVQTAPSSQGATSVKSPMPGTLMSFKVTAGQTVKRGDVLLILEAMKMENEIVAPQAGKVAALRVSVGASVNTGDPLVDLE